MSDQVIKQLYTAFTMAKKRRGNANTKAPDGFHLENVQAVPFGRVNVFERLPSTGQAQAIKISKRDGRELSLLHSVNGFDDFKTKVIESGILED